MPTLTNSGRIFYFINIRFTFKFYLLVLSGVSRMKAKFSKLDIGTIKMSMEAANYDEQIAEGLLKFILLLFLKFLLQKCNTECSVKLLRPCCLSKREQSKNAV